MLRVSTSRNPQVWERNYEDNALVFFMRGSTHEVND